MTTRRFAFFALALLIAAVTLGAGGCTKVVTVPGSQLPDTLTASGTGKVPASPDMATMSFGVTVQASEARNALAQASKVATQVSDAVQKAGVSKGDVQTQSIGLNPIYIQDPVTGKTTVSGYQAGISVNVKVRQLASLGTVIAAASGAGANSISGPEFAISDPTPYEDEATKKAVDDAKRAADAMAKAADGKVGKIVSITEQSASQAPVPLAATAESGVPIEPGKLDVQSDVVVIFALE